MCLAFAIVPSSTCDVSRREVPDDYAPPGMTQRSRGIDDVEVTLTFYGSIIYLAVMSALGSLSAPPPTPGRDQHSGGNSDGAVHRPRIHRAGAQGGSGWPPTRH
jgi:hypothetical protein